MVKRADKFENEYIEVRGWWLNVSDVLSCNGGAPWWMTMKEFTLIDIIYPSFYKVDGRWSPVGARCSASFRRRTRGGAEGARAPPPKIGKNIFQEIISYHVKCGHFCGKYHVKFRNFANFRANIMSNLKFGHFVNFSYIYFRAKMSCTPKVDWARTPMVSGVCLPIVLFQKGLVTWVSVSRSETTPIRLALFHDINNIVRVQLFASVGNGWPHNAPRVPLAYANQLPLQRLYSASVLSVSC